MFYSGKRVRSRFDPAAETFPAGLRPHSPAQETTYIRPGASRRGGAMMEDAGAPVSVHVLRPLDRPRPMQVAVRRGMPVALVIDGEEHAVVYIREMWTFEDEWWRQPIRRQYFSLLTDDGRNPVIYFDHIADRWYAQDS
jgi:hypothetical protein